MRSSNLVVNITEDAWSEKVKIMPQACTSQIGLPWLEKNSIKGVSWGPLEIRFAISK